jgi:hypothetical protein
MQADLWASIALSAVTVSTAIFATRSLRGVFSQVFERRRSIEIVVTLDDKKISITASSESEATRILSNILRDEDLASDKSPLSHEAQARDKGKES